MQGYPKHIATRQDVEHLMGYLGTPFATPENKAKGRAFLQGLLDARQHYVFDRVLADGEAAGGTEPTYRVLDGQGENQNERHQFILTDNPQARIHRMWLTAAEVEGWIAQIDGGA